MPLVSRLFTSRDKYRMCFFMRKLVTGLAIRSTLEVTIETLQNQPDRNDSIWTMHKDELAWKAIEELGWTRKKANDTTTGQIRLALKERAAAVEKKTPADLWLEVPKGLNKMNKATLQHECMLRDLDTAGQGREELIRTMRTWVFMQGQEAVKTSPEHQPAGKKNLIRASSSADCEASSTGVTFHRPDMDVDATPVPSVTVMPLSFRPWEDGSQLSFAGPPAPYTEDNVQELLRMVRHDLSHGVSLRKVQTLIKKRLMLGIDATELQKAVAEQLSRKA